MRIGFISTWVKFGTPAKFYGANSRFEAMFYKDDDITLKLAIFDIFTE